MTRAALFLRPPTSASLPETADIYTDDEIVENSVSARRTVGLIPSVKKPAERHWAAGQMGLGWSKMWVLKLWTSNPPTS